MAASGPEYVFPRDYLDNNRLNLQHYHWTELFGYLVHPNISTTNTNIRIADVGTGTGTWLTDLASRLPPTAQLDGLDISFSATPPAPWLPVNVTLRRWNVKDAEVPIDLVGVYDVVHIRNFAFVLRDNEIQEVLSRLVMLLRPGGYLQWGESDVSSFRIETTTPPEAAAEAVPGVKTDALARLLKLSQPQDPRLTPTWVPHLPTSFQAAGLGAVDADVRSAPPHLALAMHECNLPIHELVARRSGNQAVLLAVQDLMPQVLDETRNGACWAFSRWVVVGRKNV